jgi:pimeloyl-ACP methyl ester carboxylesterase
MERRTFLGRTTGAVLGTATLSSVASADEQFARVSTRGHFETNWMLQTQLQEGHTAYEYDTKGTIPGYHTDEQPEELIVFVHGWLQDESDVEKRFPVQREQLRLAGADAPVVNYSWDSDSTQAGWWIASEIARRNGRKLATFLTDYARRSPETTIRLIGFSIGGRLVPSAIESLHERNTVTDVDSVSLMGAAVPAPKVALDGEYGPGLDEDVTSIDNFWRSDDSVLNRGYGTAELTTPLGSNGLGDRKAPSGYTDHQVDYVASHNDYWKFETGCIDAVVDAWD